jgi:hypothetical protein
MFLNEAELRKVIRKRLLQEKSSEYEQSGGEIAGDVAVAAAGGVAGAAAIGTGLAIANVGSASGAAALATSFYAPAVAGGYMTTASAAGGLMGISNPVGWGILATVAIGAGLAYILLDEGDVGGDIEAILNGSWAKQTNEQLKKVEDETKKKMQEAGMEAELAGFPSFVHYNDVMGLHEKMSKRLWRATKGGFMGMGTDEDEIEKVIRAMPSLMDLSLTALKFKEAYKMDLIKVFNEELSDEESLMYTGDMEDFVRKPIQDLKNKAIICFKGKDGKKKCYSELALIAFTNEIDNLIKNPQVVEPEKVNFEKIDPNSLSGNSVKRIQYIMNRYSERFSLGKKITEDGQWGSKTDELWQLFLNHTFVNHETFKTLSYAKTYQSGMYQWIQVSKDMITNYPGYLGNTIGCLAYVTDGFNGGTVYGSGKSKITTSGGGGGGSGGANPRKKVRKDEPDIQSKIDRSGGGLVPKASIALAGPGKNTLESVGFPPATSDRLVLAISKRVRGTITGGTINLTIVTNRSGIVSNVRVAPGQRRNPINKQFENLRNVVRRFLEKAGSADVDKIEASKVRAKIKAKSRKFELVLDFPAGTYN